MPELDLQPVLDLEPIESGSVPDLTPDYSSIPRSPEELAVRNYQERQALGIPEGHPVNPDEPIISPETVQQIMRAGTFNAELPPVVKGFERRSAEQIAGMTSQSSLATLPAFAIPYVGPALGMGLGAKAFGTGAGTTVGALEAGHPEEAGAGLSEALGGAAMIAAPAIHALTPAKPPVIPEPVRVAAEKAHEVGLKKSAAEAVGEAVKPETKAAAGKPVELQLEEIPNASRVEETTAVHGDLRAQPIEGEGALPVAESGAGVQPQAERELPGGEAQPPNAEASQVSLMPVLETSDGKLYPGASHAEALQGAMARLQRGEITPEEFMKVIEASANDAQHKFQTSDGRVLDRAEAGKESGLGGNLQSEDLKAAGMLKHLEEPIPAPAKPVAEPTKPKQPLRIFTSEHKQRLAALVKRQADLPASEIAEWSLEVPPGYVLEGDRYVYKTTAPEPTKAVEPVGAPETIKAAAVKTADGTIYTGKWHPAAYDELMRATGLTKEQVIAQLQNQQLNDGFITSQGRFVGRDLAAVIAGKAKQFRPDKEGDIAFAGGLKGLESGPGIIKSTPEAHISMGAATPGAFPSAPPPVIAAFHAAAKPLTKLRAAIGQLWTSRGPREAMAATRDAGDNAAAIFARSQANEIRNALRREFPKDQKAAEDALSAMVEAGGSEEALITNRDKIELSTAGSDKWRARGLAAHDFALYHQDQLRPIAEKYSAITDAQQLAEEAAGLDTLKRRNYVMHAQDIDEPLSMLSGEGTGGAAAFRKVRTHETFADSIAAGVDPKTLNSVDLLESRLRAGQRNINSRAWMEGLRSMSDPQSGKPIGENPVTVTRADGSTYQEAPPGYSLERMGNQPIAVHNGYEGIFSALTDPSAISKSMAGRGLLTANAVGKSVNLLFDTFHLGRLAFWESLIKSLGVKTFEAPLPSYRKGVTLLDNTPAEIRRMAAAGEIPTAWLPEMLESKRRLDLMVKGGYNVGRISDALYQKVLHDLPVIGRFNKFVFDGFQRGAMSEVGLLEFERLRAARPELSEAQVARQVAKDLNTRFGNLGRQGIFKRRTAQDIARLLTLAPQWNEGLIRSELGAIKQLGEFAKDTAQGKRIYSGVLMRSVGAMMVGQFIANQIINMATRGHPTWENKEEGVGAKLSAWIPDKVGNGPGFFLHPMGLAAETTHLLMQKYERTQDFQRTLNSYLRSRSSAAMRPVLTFLTREDELGRKIKPDNIWGKIVNSAIPVPIGSPAVVQGAKQVVTGKESESFPGQFQKQILASGGIKTDQTPGPGERVSVMARDFNKRKGITPSAEFYEGDYVPLQRAIGIGNEAEAAAALEELLKKKTRAQIRTHFQQMALRPFTGSRQREGEFKRELTPDQRKAYEDAVSERRRIQRESMRLLRERPSE